MSFANKISAYNRKRNFDYFMKVIAPSKSQTILDVGFTYNEYSAEANYIEKHYPYPENITALGVECSISTEEFQNLYPKVTTITYDGNIFPFYDNQFDVGWSNAVVEHVGGETNTIYTGVVENHSCGIFHYAQQMVSI